MLSKLDRIKTKGVLSQTSVQLPIINKERKLQLLNEELIVNSQLLCVSCFDFFNTPLLRPAEVRVGIAPFFGDLLSTIKERNLQGSRGTREAAWKWETVV